MGILPQARYLRAHARRRSEKGYWSPGSRLVLAKACARVKERRDPRAPRRLLGLGRVSVEVEIEGMDVSKHGVNPIWDTSAETKTKGVAP